MINLVDSAGRTTSACSTVNYTRLYRNMDFKGQIKFPFKRKACQVYEGGCC